MTATAINRAIQKLLLCLLALLLAPIPSVADNPKGDFFGKESVRGGIFDSPKPKEGVSSEKEVIYEEPSDSFNLDKGNTETQAVKKAVSSAPNKAPAKREDIDRGFKSKLKQDMEASGKDSAFLETLEAGQKIREQIKGIKNDPAKASSPEYIRQVMEKVEAAAEEVKQPKKAKKKKKKNTASRRFGSEIGQKAAATSPSSASSSQPLKNTSSPTPRRDTKVGQDIDFRSQRRSSQGNKYRPPSVLSLIVNGKDSAHMSKNIEKLVWLKKNRKVKIGNVVIAGSKPAAESEAAALASQIGKLKSIPKSLAGAAVVGPHYKLLEAAGVPQFKKIESERIIKRLNLSQSPTWIVRHLGRDYIFEGFSNPNILFDREGNFTRASQ